MNSSLTQCKRALRLFSSDTGTKAQRHHNARAWLASVAVLGDKWTLNNPVPRKGDV